MELAETLEYRRWDWKICSGAATGIFIIFGSVWGCLSHARAFWSLFCRWLPDVIWRLNFEWGGGAKCGVNSCPSLSVFAEQ